MTEREIYDGVVVNGTTDFFCVVGELRRHNAGWCVVGGWAVNAYAEPVYTTVLKLVVTAADLEVVIGNLLAANFRLKKGASSIQARRKLARTNSSKHQLTVEFTGSERCQPFVKRAVTRTLFGVDVPVAILEDVVQEKLWSWYDPTRRTSEHIQDEMDLVRLTEGHFEEVVPLLPDKLQKAARVDRDWRLGGGDGWGEP